MDNRDNSSWLSLLRKKINNKFKRNRKLAEETLESPEELIQKYPEWNPQNCEDMKQELLKLNWYWPNLSRLEAQRLLSQQPNGSFLVRDSSEAASFTLSFRTNNKTFHCRNQWSQILATSENEQNNSLIDVIQETIKKSQSSVVGFVLPQDCDSSDVSFPSYAVRLIHPICRSNTVPTLQKICLSKIKSKVNQSNINSLPLPAKIKEYVQDNYNTL